MKLKDKRLAPIGGYYFNYEINKDGTKRELRVTSTDGGLDKLIERVKKDMQANGVPIPLDIEEVIENQICERQPEDRCWKDKKYLGDIVAGAIQSVAGTIDKGITIATGKKSNLLQKAKGCKGCKKRKEALNKLSGKK